MILLTKHSDRGCGLPGSVLGPCQVRGCLHRGNPILSVSAALPLSSGYKRHKTVSDATSILRPAHPRTGCNEYLSVHVLSHIC